MEFESPSWNELEPKSDGCFGRMRRRGCCFLCGSGSGSILKSDLNKRRGKRGIGEESWRVNWNLDGLDGKGVGRVEKKEWCGEERKERWFLVHEIGNVFGNEMVVETQLVSQCEVECTLRTLCCFLIAKYSRER